MCLRLKIYSYCFTILTYRFVGVNDQGTIEIREEGTRKLDKEIITGHAGSVRRLCLWQVMLNACTVYIYSATDFAHSI